MEYIGHFIVGVVFLSANFSLGWLTGAYARKNREERGAKGLDAITAEGKNPIGNVLIGAIGLMFLIPGIAGWQVVLYGYYGGWNAAPNLMSSIPISLLVPVSLVFIGLLAYGVFYTVTSE